MGKPKGKRTLGRPRRNWRIILKWSFRKWDVGGMDLIDLAEDRDRCLAILNAILNLQDP